MTIGFDWVDAFTNQPFGGNGCAVFHDAAALPDETCTAIVRETSLTECTFLGPSEVADVKVRYFLATQEIPFAGHPTVATVAALADRGLLSGSRVTLETGDGVVPVEITEEADGARWITMTQRAPRFGAEMDPGVVAAVGGIGPEAFAAPPQIVSTGLPFCIALLKDPDDIARLALDLAALERFRRATQGAASGFIEPFWVVRQGATAEGRTFARLLMPPPNPPEDPFTGSATGAMAAYLWAHGLIEDPVFVAEQGHRMGRPGRARVEVLGPPDAIAGVRVAGQACVLMRGELTLPG